MIFARSRYRSAPMSADLLSVATRNLNDIITLAIEHTPDKRALVIFDTQSPLSRLLTDAYRATLPHADMIDFEATTPDDVRATIDTLSPKDLVVLVQSTSFRLNEFRFRLELFNRNLAVIEHPHLGRMPEAELATFIDGLAYDPAYYRVLGPKLQECINNASRIVLRSPGAELVYDTNFEDAKPNLGDYRAMKNTGGQFPIGEVFTEPKDFSKVNGTVKLFAFGDQNFLVNVPEEPVTVVIKEGVIVDAPDAPASFVAVLDQIRADEPLSVRELGFGMNRAFTRERRLSDIGSYERMCGIHLSLGQKHTIYAKPGMPKRSSKYHVDVFAETTEVEIDGIVVYRNGTYCI